jgi:DNA-binding transcriptional LysR family regulator
LHLGVAYAALDWRGSNTIAEAIVVLTRAHPKVSVRLSVGSTPRLLDDLHDGGLDAAFVLGRSEAPWPTGTIACPISNDHLVAVAARSLGINARTPFTDLFNRRWILNPDGCGYRSLLVSFASSMGRAIDVVAEVQGASLQRDLVVAGIGVGLIPEGIARVWKSDNAGKDDLIIVKPKGKPFSISAALISTAKTQRLGRPVEIIGLALTKAFTRRPDR